MMTSLSLLFLLFSLCLNEVSSSAGPPGGKGGVGPPGDFGATGATGATGTKGVSGATGASGAKGDLGEEGDVGATGATGPKGETGATGARGEDGKGGSDGDPGQKGEAGTPGTKGEHGATGAPGAKGYVGRDADNGDPGQKGAQGQKGATGQKGDPGDDGVNGKTGPVGPTGELGPSGPKGAKGEKGSEGEVGPTGELGPVGEQGIPGVEPDVGNECEGDNDCAEDERAECIDLRYGYMCRCRYSDEFNYEWDPDTKSCVNNDNATSACEMKNGGCEDNCVPGETFVEYECNCDNRTGMQLAANLHTCEDINECEDPDLCDWKCINTEGSYKCICPPHLFLNGSKCLDRDECVEGRHMCAHVCHNQSPGYNCSCYEDFELARDGYRCISINKFDVELSLDREFDEALADPDTDEARSMAAAITDKMSACTVQVCTVNFRNGSTLATVTLQAETAQEMSESELEQLSWEVREELLGDGDTILLNGELLTVLKPLLINYDNGTGVNFTVVADRPCRLYEESGFCRMESLCVERGGQPVCECAEGFTGPYCDLPGPGYTTMETWTPMEIIQLALIGAALLFALVGAITGFAACFSRNKVQRIPMKEGSSIAPAYTPYTYQNRPYGYSRN